LYVETFAQLVTDRMVKKSDVTEVKHCQIFDKLREQQSIEYTRYYDVELGLLNYNALVIVETFLNLNNRKNLESKQGILGLLAEKYFEYLYKEHPNCRNEIDLMGDLDDIGNDSPPTKNDINSWSNYGCKRGLI
jgi:hypothetical protein